MGTVIEKMEMDILPFYVEKKRASFNKLLNRKWKDNLECLCS